MNDKIIFREMLSEIGKLAEANNNILTIEEIKEFFKGASLSDDQMELVYSYLEANKIVVEGHKKSEAIKLFEENKAESNNFEETKDNEELKNESDTPKFSVEEDKYLTMYLEELGDIEELDEQEKHILYSKVIQNDPLAKSRLIENYLPQVVEIAKGFVNNGVALSDLIQEGNIGLMLTMDNIEESAGAATLEKTLEEGVIIAIENAIDEADSIKSANKQIIGRVNYLNEGARNLEEELGRTVSIEELAKYMEMSENEIQNIIRVSDDEIVVMENKDKKSDRD
jgi:RNA polymerase primary sigma factor